MLFYLVAFKILFTQRLIGRRVHPTNAAPDFESQKLNFFQKSFSKKVFKLFGREKMVESFHNLSSKMRHTFAIESCDSNFQNFYHLNCLG